MESCKFLRLRALRAVRQSMKLQMVGQSAIQRNYHTRKGGDDAADKVRSVVDDDALLESMEKEDQMGSKNVSGSASSDPRYWRRQYNKNLTKVEEGLDQKIADRFQLSLPKVESYNDELKKDPLQRLKVNPTSLRLTLSDLIPEMSLVKAVRSHLASDQPSEFQQRFWSLMTGNLSTIGKGDQGSGRTTAVIVSALALKRNPNRGQGINSLILVKSTDLVIQYERTIKEIISHLKSAQGANSSQRVAQFLYRSDAEDELRQQTIVAHTPEPHILVSTPQRLLDLLSSRGMDFLKINNLSAIFVDDFDTMIDSDEYLESKKKAPIVQLLDYVMKLQDYRRQHNEPHPQLIFTVSNGTTSSLIEQIKEKTKWFDWARFAPLGTFDSDTNIPSRKAVPTNVAISSVLVRPYMSDKKKSAEKFKVKVYDMVPFEYGSDISNWLDKLYRSLEGNDMVYRKQRNRKKNRMSKDVKKLALDVLVGGFVKLTKKKGCSWLKQEKILMVYSDEIADSYIKKLLEKSHKAVRVFDAKEDADFFMKSEGPQILLVNTSALTGLTFKGLKNIVLLGIDTIKNLQGFVSAAGRLRGASRSGLVLEKYYTSFGEPIRPDIDIQKRIFLVNSEFDFEDIERNFLERVLIKAGLVRQFSSVGVLEPDFDKKKYNAKFVSDYGFFSSDK
ncbi:hypothetical protein FOA43_001194 [Brettanomyces nanus]|uniref:ATP-dependent RNA helicase n=1 Tax=Eeniella nana TaxID=13502 RepID=A0A875S219_EENNA|nr:uncharacterized protein FOA43_001194 [Brettanomyces nanus]QPG73879.1 hypothetical protein FOA43_001194 [Brettanomyces nanus]